MNTREKIQRMNRINARSKIKWTPTKPGGWRLYYDGTTYFVSPSMYHADTWHVTAQSTKLQGGRASIGESLPSAQAGKDVVEKLILGDV